MSNVESTYEQKWSTYNQKQEQVDLRLTDNKVLKSWKAVIDLTELGKLFQSDGALNLKARPPISLKILGTKKGWVWGWACLSEHDESNGTKRCFKYKRIVKVNTTNENVS